MMLLITDLRNQGDAKLEIYSISIIIILYR